jgi:hypothetical protein
MRFCADYTHREQESVRPLQQGMCRKGKTMDATWASYRAVRNVRFEMAVFGKSVPDLSDDDETLLPDIHSSTHNDGYYEYFSVFQVVL